MTYARFLGLFVVLPLLFLVVRYRKTFTARSLAPLGLLLVVVYVATTPWDNLAVKWGLWARARRARVLSARESSP